MKSQHLKNYLNNIDQLKGWFNHEHLNNNVEHIFTRHKVANMWKGVENIYK